MRSFTFTKSYDGRVVLSVPELDWKSGTITSVIGANGSGKSTFGKILSGIVRPDGNNSALSGGKVGYLPQKAYALRMSTEKNIMLNGDDRALAEQMMDALNLSSLRKRNANRLSGGETAKMVLARILMRRYDLLILDEPTAAMDMESTIAAERLIRVYVELNQSAVILITHSISQAMRLSDRVMYLEAGKLVEFGDAQKILKMPQSKELHRFLDFYGT